MTAMAVEDRRPLVLMADDDEVARVLIEHALTDANFRVVQAQDGREAVDAFPRERPDIVLLDVNMPVMDGYEACRVLRGLRGGERVPVLMVSAYEGNHSINLAYEAGATDFLTKSSNWTVVAYRVRYLLRAARALAEGKIPNSRASGRAARMSGTRREAGDRPANDEDIRRLDGYDSLTGLRDRLRFHEQLSSAIAGCARTRQPLALMFFDLDRFKRINDAYGHAVGDQLLAAAAKRVAACLRGSERLGRGSPEGATAGEAQQTTQEWNRLGRSGGDKFCLFLANIGEPGHAGTVARRVLAELARPICIGRHEIALGASLGIAMYPADGEDSETLMRNAEAATYRVKEEGGNDYRFFAGTAATSPPFSSPC